MFAYCGNNPVVCKDSTGTAYVFLGEYMAEVDLDGHYDEGGLGGGGWGLGVNPSYYTSQSVQSYDWSWQNSCYNPNMTWSTGATSQASAPYADLVDPPGVGPGKDFTAAQKAQIIQQNKKANGGVVRSDLSGIELTQPLKSMKGVTPSPLEWQIDHIVPKCAGGTNSFANAQVLLRYENRLKWDNYGG